MASKRITDACLNKSEEYETVWEDLSKCHKVRSSKQCGQRTSWHKALPGKWMCMSAHVCWGEVFLNWEGNSNIFKDNKVKVEELRGLQNHIQANELEFCCFLIFSQTASGRRLGSMNHQEKDESKQLLQGWKRRYKEFRICHGHSLKGHGGNYSKLDV